MASTIRWLSTANEKELTSRLSVRDPASPSPEQTGISCSPLVDQVEDGITNENVYCSVESKTPTTLECNLPDTKLPTIPSFSNFIKSKKAEGRQLSPFQNHSPSSTQKNRDKRARYE